jgi:hypothetical protein
MNSAEHVDVIDSAIYQDKSWCSKCGGPQTFVAIYEFDGGRVGCCLGCGDERVVPFTRTTTEAA